MRMDRGRGGKNEQKGDEGERGRREATWHGFDCQSQKRGPGRRVQMCITQNYENVYSTVMYQCKYAKMYSDAVANFEHFLQGLYIPDRLLVLMYLPLYG